MQLLISQCSIQSEPLPAGELQARQDALNALAADTGGRALRNTNFFDRWVTNVLDETSNYYLVAWRPETEQEKASKFRHVKISVVGQPELTVRAPRGYVEGPNPAAASTAATNELKPALRTLSPGRYDLKVTITDGLAGATASQVANFIVR